MGSSSKVGTGAYTVKESGLQYKHANTELPTPKDGDEFLERFQ